jgi:hypothetical protein
MKKYYKHYAESDDGAGIAYLEAEGEIVLRQVEVYGERIFWSDRQTEADIRHRICDQPVSILGLTPKDEATPEEFESVWRRAKQTSSEAS